MNSLLALSAFGINCLITLSTAWKYISDNIKYCVELFTTGNYCNSIIALNTVRNELSDKISY